jgi:hydrogenase maturation protein HypF
MPQQDTILKQAWQRRINAPQTSSAGRLFDAAAALTGVCSTASFEGQGPMQLEALCSGKLATGNVALGIVKQDELLITDWQALLPVLLDPALSVTERAALFHTSLAHAMLQQANNIRQRSGVNRVGFSGGVFQNRVLTEQAIALLSADGFEVFFPELIPVNDAGISFGQVIEYGFRNMK